MTPRARVCSFLGLVLLLAACGRAEPSVSSDAILGATQAPTAAPPEPAPVAARNVAGIHAGAGASTVDPIPIDRMCVTSGTIERQGATRFTVTAPTFRAVSSAGAESRAELRFKYLGPSATTRALGSGAVRQQLGLKLRAQDPCNLVYVMWRLDPESKLVVSVKRNPGARTSAECGNRGYTNLRGILSAPVPPVAAGSSHALRAELNGPTLQVFADDVLVWKGDLGAEALAIDGPVGVRTDNVHIEAELRGVVRSENIPCAAGGEASE